MFTLPPRPPKDYILSDVTKNLQSSLQFTPNALPRVTQPSLGKYSFPINYKDEEVPEKRPPDPVEPSIMRKMVNDARDSWVVDPGKNSYLIQEIFDKYAVVEKAADLDPRYKHKERIFNRSYKYELYCIEAVRLHKLRYKCRRDTEKFEGDYEKLLSRQKAREKPKIQVLPCKEGPPFWWKGEVPGQKKDEAPKEGKKVPWVSKHRFIRWHEEPELIASAEDDPCRRKYDLLTVGLDFRTDACHYYDRVYPDHKIKFRPKRFA